MAFHRNRPLAEFAERVPGAERGRPARAMRGSGSWGGGLAGCGSRACKAAEVASGRSRDSWSPERHSCPSGVGGSGPRNCPVSSFCMSQSHSLSHLANRVQWLRAQTLGPDCLCSDTRSSIGWWKPLYLSMPGSNHLEMGTTGLWAGLCELTYVKDLAHQHYVSILYYQD